MSGSASRSSRHGNSVASFCIDRAGLNVIKEKIARDGEFVSKDGKVRRKLGRPGAEADKLDRARQELAKGTGICKTAKLTGLTRPMPAFMPAAA